MGRIGRVMLGLACLTPACDPGSKAGNGESGERLPEQVQAAFDGSCAEAGCHVRDTMPAGLSLEAADAPQIVGGPSQQSILPIVRVGSLAGSFMAHKLLPDRQLPQGVLRPGDRMPPDETTGDDIKNINTILSWIAGYGPSAGSAGDSVGGDSSGSVDSFGDGWGSSSSDTGSITTNSTNSGGGPSNPPCSVEAVTEGAITAPLDKGLSAGQIPFTVGEVFEARCGCHTLSSADMAVKFPFLQAPGGTLFLDYGDLTGGNLGSRCETQIFATGEMPPGSCPRVPDDDEAILQKWFDDGMPDGGNFVPP